MKSKTVLPTQPVVEVVACVCRESPEKESLAGGEHKQDGKMVDYVLPGRGIKLMLFDCKNFVLSCRGIRCVCLHINRSRMARW